MGGQRKNRSQSRIGWKTVPFMKGNGASWADTGTKGIDISHY